VNEDACYNTIDEHIRYPLPHLRTDIPFPVLVLIVELEWLAVVVAYGHRDGLTKASRRGTDLSGVELGASEEEGTS